MTNGSVMNDGGLAALIRLRRWRIDQERRLLAGRLRDVAARSAELAAFDAEIAGEREIAAGSDAADVGLAYAAYANRAAVCRVAALQAIAAAKAGAAAQREIVVACHRDLRSAELAEEARRQRMQRAADRRERMLLDELALTARGRGA